MNLVLRLDAGALRQWHVALAERLARRPGLQVGVRLVEGPAAPGGVEALFRFETLLFALGRGGPAQRVAPQRLAAFAEQGEPYLIVDLAAEPARVEGRVWRVECDGLGLEPGLLAALLAGRTPTLRVLGPKGPISAGRPGAETLGMLKTSFEEMLARAATLIEAALDGAAPAAALAPLKDAEPPARPAQGFFPLAAKMAKRRAVRAVYAAACHAPHWRVGWRRTRGAALGEGLGEGWTDLPDDGRRFYADPFPIVWKGRTYLFVEEFEHALGRGVISALEMGAQGPLGAPERVLEQPGHLSYPNVFEADGEMWMIPESGSAGTIDLFRATAFPGGWKREATLVAGVCANDATLFQRDGKWWMFATVRDGESSYSDSLWLWSAPDFRGPWAPHALNPVMVDSASARPAGRMFEQGGALWRPVQDCRRGYGAAMALARVDRLDEGGFSQTIATVLKPGGGWPGRRVHTYNEAGGFEFIDGSAFAPKWRLLRGPLRMAQRRELRVATA